VAASIFNDIPPELGILEKVIQQGDPVKGWPGDPRMELRVGVLSAAKTGWSEQVHRLVVRGEPLARRLEVWRHTETGRDERIGTWNFDELPHVVADLVLMDPSRPNHESILDRIDRTNAEKEYEATRIYQDVAGEMAEHLAKLNHDRNNPRNVFRGIPGTRDRTDLKRAR
jgi:hypothetical protein